MDIKELRIGSLIKWKSTGDLDYVVKIDITIKNVCVNNVNIEDCEAVPLAEEWLLKLGFKKYIGWDDMDFWCLPDEGGKSDRFELYVTNQGFESPSGKIIEYVHTLQNCYFFHELSGKELL